MSEYGCNLKNQNDAVEKAKGKKDGFYTLRGMGYRVLNGKVTHIADSEGIFECCGWFNVKVGFLSQGNRKSKGQLLKEVFNKL